MKHNTEIDIVIPTYNGSNHIQGILKSVKEQSFQNYQCFVIDDCSKDDTANIVKEYYPWVKLLKQITNQGPAKNRNIAIKNGSSPYIVIFDDDTFLDDSRWLETALGIMKGNHKIGQIASMILCGTDKNILLDCGITRNGYVFGGIHHRDNIKDILKKHNTLRSILGACTAGTIISRDAFEKVGGFDEKYFYLAEDVELSLRIHLAGYDVMFEPSLKTYHLESQAMGKDVGRKLYLLRRNSLMAIMENMPCNFIAIVLLRVILRQIVLRSIIYFLSTRFGKRQLDFPLESIHYIEILRYLKKNTSYVIKKRARFNKVRTRPRKYLMRI